jgi:hypothetical protein
LPAPSKSFLLGPKKKINNQVTAGIRKNVLKEACQIFKRVLSDLGNF